MVSCRRNLYNQFSNVALNELKQDETMMLSALTTQNQLFDAQLESLQSTVDKDIIFDNFITGVVFISLIIVVIYLLYSETFV